MENTSNNNDQEWAEDEKAVKCELGDDDPTPPRDGIPLLLGQVQNARGDQTPLRDEPFASASDTELNLRDDFSFLDELNQDLKVNIKRMCNESGDLLNRVNLNQYLPQEEVPAQQEWESEEQLGFTRRDREATGRYRHVENDSEEQLELNRSANEAASTSREVDREDGEYSRKHKKSKKKRSRKGSKDRSREKNKRHRSRSRSRSREHKRKRSHHQDRRDSLDYVPVRESEKVFRPIKLIKLMPEKPNPHSLRIMPKSFEEKKNLGIQRAKALLKIFEDKANNVADKEFLSVKTIRKLPINNTYMNQNVFENPSPISNNFNVQYRFNTSEGSRIPMRKWGLERMPDSTAQLLRITTIDVDRLKGLLAKPIYVPRMLKLLRENANKPSYSEEQSHGSLYTSIGTQTCTSKSTDVGVQINLDIKKHNDVFWRNPNFDEIYLTQHQENVMYALKELTKSLPHPIWASHLYKALMPALTVKREMEYKGTPNDRYH